MLFCFKSCRTLKKIFLLISLVIVSAFVFSLQNSFAAGNTISRSSLSPALNVASYDLEQALRAKLVDEFAGRSILSDFEYRALKLDIFFNARIDPQKIEEEFRFALTNEMIYIYFKTNPADREERLKIRNIFQQILERNGLEMNGTMLEYMNKLMIHFSGRIKEYNHYNREWIFLQIRAALKKELSPEEIFFYSSNKYSIQWHSLKKDVQRISLRILRDYGAGIDSPAAEKIDNIMRDLKTQLLEKFNTALNGGSGELKAELCRGLSAREIGCYFSRDPYLEIERQEARKKAFKIFTAWLGDRGMYFEGDCWAYYYKVKLRDIMRQLVEVDPVSHDLSLRKMLGRKVKSGVSADVYKALDIIAQAVDRFREQPGFDYRLNARLRVCNTGFFDNFAFCDEELILKSSSGTIWGPLFLAQDVWFIDNGSKVLHVKNNPQTQKKEFFVFSPKAPYVSLYTVQADNSGIYRRLLKRKLKDEFTREQLKPFAEHSALMEQGKLRVMNSFAEKKWQVILQKEFSLPFSAPAWRLFLSLAEEVYKEYDNISQPSLDTELVLFEKLLVQKKSIFYMSLLTSDSGCFDRHFSPRKIIDFSRLPAQAI